MRVDTDKSKYSEDPRARSEYNRRELKRLRFLLRRLQFLEAKIRATGSVADGNASAVYAELEIESLEWILGDVDFLMIKTPAPAGS